MAIKVTYVVKEAGQNLRRNVLMTTTAIITVAISLALAGSALLLRYSVDNAFRQFRGGFELTVYMKPDASTEESNAIKRQLDTSPFVKDKRFIDKAAAFDDFKALFENSPDYKSAITSPDQLPTSYQISPKRPEDIDSLAASLRKQAGVLTVSSLGEGAKALLGLLHNVQLGILVVAVVLLGAAVLLILNTIRMAIFARRREVAVMKLVGATNWFIRIPFMIEGMLQGVLGALLAAIVVVGGSRWVEGNIRDSTTSLFKQFSVSSGQTLSTGIVVLVVGALAGAIGSAFAVSRFLDV